MSPAIEIRRWSDSEARDFVAFGGELHTKIGGDLDTAECLSFFEQFDPLDPASRFAWTNWYDEVDIVVAGKANVTIWWPPTYVQTSEFEVAEGDSFFVPAGCKVLYDAQGTDPYRHLLIQMPRPPSTAEEDLPSFHNRSG